MCGTIKGLITDLILEAYLKQTTCAAPVVLGSVYLAGVFSLAWTVFLLTPLCNGAEKANVWGNIQ